MVHQGEYEGVKAGVHGALGGLALVCVVYNLCAFLHRRERHLAANVVVYSLIAALETRKIVHHLCAS